MAKPARNSRRKEAAPLLPGRSHRVGPRRATVAADLARDAKAEVFLAAKH